ncbi:DENN domain-containing protein 1B isoform X1 [Anarrhichthys ocellatus]|uniref:DENN domain-containing protein 1B isoform X1 n=1 Tax=Anarrhichthys ocellatus TaxID=433405 RepID=UPI0012ED49C6|nr:DENN domain-containing protein 1B-like isoform X1 [Anarrhichthys ocellatus]
MGSRLKQNPEQTFYWFFEATCPVARDKDPGVLFQYPEDFSDEESFQTLPRFCFPYDIQRAREGVAVQHFTFVLTDLEGCQRFGFCRLTNNTNTCLCILSYLPWFEVFYKLLNNLADYLTKGQTNETKALLAALYKQPLPPPAGSVTLQMGEQLLVSTEVSHPVGHPKGQEGVPYFIAPDPRSLPSIPENRNLTELIVAVDVGNLLQVYASMLFERRILIFASKLSTLTSCVHALSAVLYPMYWQHIFIPVLPPHLLDYCCAPMPYLIGVHTSLSERVRSRGLEEVVILNVDTNTLETPFDDLKRIPSDVMSGLKACLKRQAVSPGCGVSRAFLKAQALLFGGYRDALQGQKEGEMWFSEELFLDHKSASMRQFLQSAIHLQSFKQFIDGRLDILNKEKEPDDLFEEEIFKCETAAGRSKSYQQLVGNLKKGGGALILNMKSKANMRAKGLTKSGLKNLLMHKAHSEEHALQRGGSVSHRRAQSDCLQNRLPITQHFGRSRPRRPVSKLRAPGDEEDMQDTGDAWAGAVSEPAVDPDSELQKDEEEGEDSLLCDPEEMDLLGEIFDTLSSRSSHERGLLYGTRSLDLFGPDSHDYITKDRFTANPSQESLSLSISGSGSLHSWNLETTEELSDLTEDSDWLCLDTSLPEEEGTDSRLAVCEVREQEIRGREVREEQEEVKVAINRNQEEEIDDRNNFGEVRLEEETKKAGQEKRVSLGEDTLKEMADKLKDEQLRENREYEQNQNEVAEGREIEKGTSEMQINEAREEEGKDEQEEKIKEVTLNKLIKLNPHHPNPEEDNLKPTASPGPRSLIVDPEPPAAQDKRSEEEVKKEEQEMRQRQTPCPPKVPPPVARFQSQDSRGFQVKSGTKELAEPGRLGNMLWSREKAQTQPPCDSNISEEKKRSEGHECEDPPLIKVSELKKRFEA